MPFRDQDLIELCTECKAPATTRCLRCQRPLCDRHAPPRKQRCRPCEAYFDEILPTEVPTARRVAIEAGTVLGCLPAVFFVWGAGLTSAFLAILMFGVWGLFGFIPGFVGAAALVKRLYDVALSPERALVRAQKRARRRFLRQRKQPRGRLTE